MVYISNDAFLTQLASLFSDTATKGSVFITVKQRSAKALAPGELPQAIYRATTGKRRIATLVAVADLPTFTSNYSALMKGCMGALKKPKKADKKKTARKATS